MQLDILVTPSTPCHHSWSFSHFFLNDGSWTSLDLPLPRPYNDRQGSGSHLGSRFGSLHTPRGTGSTSPSFLCPGVGNPGAESAGSGDHMGLPASSRYLQRLSLGTPSLFILLPVTSLSVIFKVTAAMPIVGSPEIFQQQQQK